MKEQKTSFESSTQDPVDEDAQKKTPPPGAGSEPVGIGDKKFWYHPESGTASEVTETPEPDEPFDRDTDTGEVDIDSRD